MSIKLNIKEHWIEEGTNPRRLMTIDEYLEEQCEICLENPCTHEIDFEGELIYVCGDCCKMIASGLIDGNDNLFGDFKVFKF